MTRSGFIALVRYVNVFGDTDWLREDEARDKLAHEQALYDRYRADADGPRPLSQPRIEKS